MSRSVWTDKGHVSEIGGKPDHWLRGIDPMHKPGVRKGSLAIVIVRRWSRVECQLEC